MEYGDQPDICLWKITNSLAILRLRKPLKTSTRLAGHGIWTRDLPNASLVRYHGATSLGKEDFILFCNLIIVYLEHSDRLLFVSFSDSQSGFSLHVLYSTLLPYISSVCENFSPFVPAGNEKAWHNLSFQCFNLVFSIKSTISRRKAHVAQIKETVYHSRFQANLYKLSVRFSSRDTNLTVSC